MDTSNKVLTGTVFVRNPDTGEQRRFSAGTKPPAAWAKLITNPKAWEDEPTAAESEDDGDTSSNGGDGGSGGSSGGASTDEPARNASTEAWRTFAKDNLDVEFEEDVSRADIIASLEERGLIESADS